MFAAARRADDERGHGAVRLFFGGDRGQLDHQVRFEHELLQRLAGVVAGTLAGLSPGGVTMVAILGASASYIAVPAAMRIAVPEARHNLSITASLAITFPFNVLVGIPLYTDLVARWA